MNNRTITILSLCAFVFFLATIISYMLFSPDTSSTGGKTAPLAKNGQDQVEFDQSLPKTESCPLNGEMYSKQQREWWEEHRPLGVMIENHEESRPQSGFSSADVVYEAIAEGGITRFLAVFYCQDAGIVGPVRSARTYFVDLISEYGNYPLYAHVGGANTPGPANALGQIVDYGWNVYNDINQFSIGFPDFFQDRTRLGREVATEHTMYSKTGTLWKIGQKRGLTDVDKEGEKWDKGFVSYSFKEDAPTAERGMIQNIHIEMWEKFRQYMIDWDYDKATNSYKRRTAGKLHLDKNTNKQLTAKNIVVLSMIESNANDGYENNAHLLYKTKGTGKATIFMDGKRVNGTWKKDSRTDRTIISDATGKPINFNRGKIWFEILPIDGVMTVK